MKTQKSANPSAIAKDITQSISLLKKGVKIPLNQPLGLFEKTVTDIDKSLRTNDIPSVWKSWSLLVEQNLVQFLGPPQLYRYTEHIASEYGREPITPDGYRAMSEIALFTAAAGHPKALNTIFLSLIKAERPNDLLDLYRKYAAKLLSAKAKDENQNEEKDDPESDYFLSHKFWSSEILLSAITACSMSNSFEEAVRIVLEANIHLHEPTVQRMLPHLPNSDRVKQFVQRLGTVRILGHTRVLTARLANLTRDHNVKELESLYNSIIDGISGPEPWLSVGKSSSPASMVAVPNFAWRSMIMAFMTCKRLDLVEKLWDDMVNCGVDPQVETWTALFDGYGILRAYQESHGTWNAMISQGVKPHPLTYRAIIATMFKCRRPKDAMDKFLEFEESRSSQKEPTADTSDDMHSQIMALYNTVLQGLFTSPDKEHAGIEFFKRMQQQGPQPDMISWNTLMAYYARRGNLNLVSSALQGLQKIGMKGDAYTYSIVLSTLLKAGKKDAIELVTGIMKKNGIEINATINTSIIDHIMQTPDAANLKAAISILNRMENEESVQARPTEVTYSTLLRSIYHGHSLSSEQRDAHVKDILRRINDRDIRLSKPTYHILFRACFDCPPQEARRYALTHYQNMLQQRIAPDWDTWYIMLEGLLRTGNIQIANDMVDEMKNKWFEPSGPGIMSFSKKKPC